MEKSAMNGEERENAYRPAMFVRYGCEIHGVAGCEAAKRTCACAVVPMNVCDSEIPSICDTTPVSVVPSRR